MPGETQNAPPQTIAFGKYLLLERISHGGMAEVFRAKAQGTAGFERVVAIKLLLPQVADDTDFITMLIDEAKIAGQLSHANIAQIFDLGQVDGRYYIAQEYVPGKDLRAILRHLEERGARLSVAQSCHIILKVCEALDYAHNKRDPSGQPLNLVHRDISPQNVIVSHEGEVKLIDFGIVKAEGRATRTLAGLVKGKFAYMSPEQIRGLPVDRRSDVFACGILLHELLSGRPLFKRGTEFETLQRARVGEIEPPSLLNPEVTQALDRVALRALARHVDDRYQSALALRDGLWEVVRENGHYHSRDQLAAWMLETFGGPDAAAPAAVQPSPGLGARFVPAPADVGEPEDDVGDEDGDGDGDALSDSEDDAENMTMVDPGLAARVRLVVDDVESGTGETSLRPFAGIGEIAGRDSAAVTARRDVAPSSHLAPDTDGDSVQIEAADSVLDLAPAPSEDPAGGVSPRRGGAGEEEETTSARAARDLQVEFGRSEPLAWAEPQTPTRRRDPRDGAKAFAVDPAADGASAPERAPSTSVPAAAPLTALPLPPTRLGSPARHASPSPVPVARQASPSLSPVASPDAVTIGPGRELPVPAVPGPSPAGYPPIHDHRVEQAYPPAPGPSVAPGPKPMPVPSHLLPPHGPGPMASEGYGDFVAGPHGRSPAASSVPSSGSPPAMWTAEPKRAGFTAPVADLRPAYRYLVAAAVIVLLAAATASIVLAVTGG